MNFGKTFTLTGTERQRLVNSTTYMTEIETPEVTLSRDSTTTAQALKTLVEVVSGRKIEFGIILGDLTEVDVDAIACPANPGFEYAGFGGVQVAIARRAGMATFEEAEAKAKAYIASRPKDVSIDGNFVGVPLGFATATASGNLDRIRTIIHVNNMRVDKQPPCDEDVVRQCVGSVLAVAESEGLTSVAFPAMGTGVWGMSMAESISGTIKGIQDYFREINSDSGINKISLVIYAQPTLANANELKSIMVNEVAPQLKSSQQ